MTAEEKLLELLEIQDKLDQIIKERNQLMDNADVDVSGAYPKPIFNQYEQKTLNELCKEEVDLTRKKDNFIKTHNVDNDFALVKAEYKRLMAPIDELEIQAEQIEEQDSKMRSANDGVIESNALSSGMFFSAAAVMVTSIIYAIKFGIFNPIATFVISILIAVSLIFCIVIGCQNKKYKRRSKRGSIRNNFFKKSNYDQWKKISDEKNRILSENQSKINHLEATIYSYERALNQKLEDSIRYRDNRDNRHTNFSTSYSKINERKSNSFSNISGGISVVALVIAFIIELVFVGIAGVYNTLSMSFVWTSAAFISAAVAIAFAFNLPHTATKKEKGSMFIGGLIGGFLLPLIPAAILVIIIAVVVQAFAGHPYVRMSKIQIQELEITSIESEYSETLNLTETGSLYWEFYGIIDYPYYFGGDNQKTEAEDIIETTFENRDTYYAQPTCVTWNDGNNVTSAKTNSGALGNKITVKIKTDGISEIKMLVGVYKGSNNYMTVYDENGDIVESALIVVSNSEEKQSLLTFDLSDYDGEIFTVVFECYESTNNGISLTAVTVS